LNHKTASVRFRQQLVNDTSLLSLPLDQLLVVGSLPQFIHLIFSSSLYIKIQPFLNHKMASVGLEPHLVNDTSLLSLPLDHLLLVGSLAQLIHLTFFFSMYNQYTTHFKSDKMASVGFEPQLVHDTVCCLYH
jgi:hypothetical protein